MRKFFELMGVIFTATIAHEIYHVFTKDTTAIGIQFGPQGGFFTRGYGDSSETVAYVVTFIMLIVGFYFVFRSPVSRSKSHKKW